MTNVSVRRASTGDAQTIAEVHVRSWRAAYRGLVPDDVLDRLSVAEREQSWRTLLGEARAPHFTLVADAGDGVVGFCSVAVSSRDDDADEQTAEIAALYVDPDCWRQGVGATMLEAICEEMRARGLHQATLWVLPGNDAALSFYNHFGFKADGGEKREDRSGQIVIRLRAVLAT